MSKQAQARHPTVRMLHVCMFLVLLLLLWLHPAATASLTTYCCSRLFHSYSSICRSFSPSTQPANAKSRSLPAGTA